MCDFGIQNTEYRTQILKYLQIEKTKKKLTKYGRKEIRTFKNKLHPHSSCISGCCAGFYNHGRGSYSGEVCLIRIFTAQNGSLLVDDFVGRLYLYGGCHTVQTEKESSRNEYFEAIVIAIVEGLTEFLPVSSTGHMILAQGFLGVKSDEFVKAFTVIIRIGAIISVLVLY